MKKYTSYLLLSIGFLVFFSNIVIVEASSISYVILNNTTATSTNVSVSRVIDRKVYDCDTMNYTCVLVSERVAATTSPAIREITIEELIEKDKNATTTKSTYIPPAIKPQVHGKFTLPARAVSVAKSPDEKKIAYYLTEEGMVKTYSSFILLFEDGKSLEKFQPLRNWDLITDNTWVLGWNGKSDKLVYIDDRTGFQQLYVVDLKEDNKNLLGKPLVTKKYTVFDFTVKDDEVYFIANRKGYYDWGLFSINLETEEFKEISSKISYTNNLVASGDNIIYAIEKDGQSILQAYNTKTKENKSFTGIPEEKVEVFKYEKVPNLNATIIKPKDNGFADSKKAIIWLHGGPYRQSAPQRHPYGSYATYDFILDEMVREGVTVMKVDYPGSMGFGSDFSNSLINKIGKADVDYVNKAIKYLNSKGIKDIYLFGNSYGGYLSLKGLVELNSKLSGAIAAAPVTDWEVLIRKVSPTPFEAHFNGTTTEKNQKLYDQASIVKKYESLTKPIILFHGELDKQVPFSQSEYLFKAFKEVDKNIKYYSVINQAHIFSGVSQNEAICQKIGEFIGLTSSKEEFCKLK